MMTTPIYSHKPPYMRTIMGREIEIHNPDPKLLCIFDVAHGLAFQCRYAGHVRHFYSIAEHCYWASILVEPKFALEALLHDAAETNLNDLIQPVKAEISGYKPIEEKHERAYAVRFSLRFPFPSPIKKADQAMYALESVTLRHRLSRENHPEANNIGIQLHCWSPRKARKQYLRRYFLLADKSSKPKVIKQIAAWLKERMLTLRFALQLDFDPVK